MHIKSIDLLILTGQCPPPYHGQNVVTGFVFGIEDWGCEVERHEIKFSQDLQTVGRFSLSKLTSLLRASWLFCRLGFANRGRDTVLYYCAGSANWVPLLRDAVLLGIFGRLFARRVAHFHSGGLPEWFERSTMEALCGRLAYGGLEKAIGLTQAVRVPVFGDTAPVIVANGLDVPVFKREEAKKSEIFEFLFLGNLYESKGLGVILQAIKRMRTEALTPFRVRFVGEWSDEATRRKWLGFVEEYDLSKWVRFSGRLTGDEKWRAYQEASCFVFPSFYESENQPLVVIEAMGMGLPIISTEWRGIPEMISDGKEGCLVAPQNDEALALAMTGLLQDPVKCEKFSAAARARYESSFSLHAFENRMKEVLTG